MTDLVRFTSRVAGYDVGDVVDPSETDDPRVTAAIEAGRAVPVESLTGVVAPESPVDDAKAEDPPADDEPKATAKKAAPRKATAPKG